MYGKFWALIPPVVAILLALITKEAYSSLFVGILIGAFFVAGFNPIATIDTIINDGLIEAIKGNAGIFLFLILLGIIVALINASGGSQAFGRWAEKNIKTKAGAQIATFVLGVLIFVDDYFNCLTVGSVMRPITDSKKISRAKLAYLIDATAAPICMIAPISSWAAAVSSVAKDINTGINGIQLFCKAIFFNYYSLLTFIFIIGLVILKFDFGPMAKYEKAALKGDLGGLESKDDDKGNPKGKVIDLILPVAVLICTCIVGMIYIGGFWGPVETILGEDAVDNSFNFINAFADTDSTIGLPWGAVIALVIIIIYLLIRRVIKFKDAMECLPKGFKAMVPAMLILTLAVSLKNMTSILGADVFVSGLMEGAAGGLYSFLPAVIFIVACFLAFSTGTSWGTFGILIPIVTAMFPPESTLFIVGISACLAGAVCGDHCSPISDTTIMASAGAQIEHVNHVSTQLPYALTVAGVSFATYIAVGILNFVVKDFVLSAVIGLVIGAIFTIATLFVLKLIFGKEKAEAEA
ncbi:MAG: Na+/H+ antiporter NhaC family protein [Lachnospiraceae bacterium]|nr:Na+/H+ antiporter NhaC family protein [Lachnospiraceae bacterium]